MSRHYTRQSSPSEIVTQRVENGDRSEDDVLTDAGDALREADIEAAGLAAEPGDANDGLQLETLSIDELRAMASELNVPNLGQIVEQSELIAAIRERL